MIIIIILCHHFLLLADVSVPDPGEDLSYCREGYTEFYDSCFKVISTPQSFAKANDACKSDGTNLASISNVYEQAFVETIVHSTEGADALWIGLVDDKVSLVFPLLTPPTTPPPPKKKTPTNIALEC